MLQGRTERKKGNGLLFPKSIPPPFPPPLPQPAASCCAPRSHPPLREPPLESRPAFGGEAAALRAPLHLPSRPFMPLPLFAPQHLPVLIPLFPRLGVSRRAFPRPAHKRQKKANSFFPRRRAQTTPLTFYSLRPLSNSYSYQMPFFEEKARFRERELLPRISTPSFVSQKRPSIA